MDQKKTDKISRYQKNEKIKIIKAKKLRKEIITKN